LIINFGYGHERGHYGDLSLSRVVLGPLLIQALLQLALAAVFVRRYSRRLPGHAAKAVPQARRRVWWPWTLRLPRRGIALTWLTLRQAVPMCLPGLVIAGLMTPFQMDVAGVPGGFLQRYTDSLPSSMWIVGLLWSVVVGAGIFSAEIDSRSGEFWRGLPMPVWRLFTVKFLAGLLATLLVLDGTTIAATWQSPNWGDYYSMNWPYIGCLVPLHATMFAVAVAWTCFLRRAVLGAMAAIVSFALMNLGLEWSEATRGFDPIEVYNNLHNLSSAPVRPPADFTAHGYPIVAATMGLILLASILVGWLALRAYPSTSAERGTGTFCSQGTAK
jgi:hypothetical protein